jgi:glucose/arabinose dehydrogenase
MESEETERIMSTLRLRVPVQKYRRRNLSRFALRSTIGASLLLFMAWTAPPAAPQAASLPVGFTEALVSGGLSNPSAMEFAPNGSLFVAEQGGNLRVIQNGTLLSTPFVSLSVDSSGERGLLGVTFHPEFATNPYVYVYHTVPGSGGSAPFNRVTRFLADPNNPTVALNSGETVITLPNLSGATNHNGGGIHFGTDGKLYVAVGDNANPALARSLNSTMGKMLRVNPDGTIPTDNPFFNTATGDNRMIYATGFRNPFTFAVQPGTGRIFVNDVGQVSFEEINDLLPGRDYGWNATEGPNPAGIAGIEYPFFSYARGSGPDTGRAITGGAFYNPLISTFAPNFVGDDLLSGWIRVLDTSNGSNISSAFATGIPNPVDLKVSNDGGLYYLARGSGNVYRISGTFSFSVAAPEPSALALLIGAIVPLALRRRL